jgi:hypothetical protein
MGQTIDQIRASKLPSNMMQFAARGALSVPPDENLEILVYLARHNKVFGDLARMTLAGWDEKASLAAASDPKTAREVLEYLISPENLRPKLLPALLENPSVPDSELVKFAISASPENIATMLQSARVRTATNILQSLRSNPYVKPNEASMIAELLGGSPSAGTNEISAAATEPVLPVEPSGGSGNRRRGRRARRSGFCLSCRARCRNCCGRREALPADRWNYGFAGGGLLSGICYAGDWEQAGGSASRDGDGGGGCEARCCFGCHAICSQASPTCDTSEA